MTRFITASDAKVRAGLLPVLATLLALPKDDLRKVSTLWLR